MNIVFNTIAIHQQTMCRCIALLSEAGHAPNRLVKTMSSCCVCALCKLLLELCTNAFKKRKRYLPSIGLVCHHKKSCKVDTAGQPDVQSLYGSELAGRQSCLMRA